MLSPGPPSWRPHASLLWVPWDVSRLLLGPGRGLGPWAQCAPPLTRTSLLLSYIFSFHLRFHLREKKKKIPRLKKPPAEPVNNDLILCSWENADVTPLPPRPPSLGCLTWKRGEPTAEGGYVGEVSGGVSRHIVIRGKSTRGELLNQRTALCY